MRVMMTTDTVGGVWTYTRELVEGVLKAGDSVTLVSLGRMPSTSQQQWADGLASAAPRNFRFIPTDFRLEWMPNGQSCFDDSAEFFTDLIEQEQPELFHSNQLCYGALPTGVPKLVVAHSDVVSWWHARHGQAPPQSAWMDRYRGLVSRGLHGADCVVAPTTWYLQQLIEHYGELRRTKAIPNGRTRMVRPATERKLQAVTAGRLWDEGKNVAILREVRASVPILVAGDAEMPADNGTVIVTSIAGPQFLGVLDDAEVWQLFSESEIYLATSRYEPFGLAPLEAVFAGCALIANDIPTFREVWGDTALYYRRNHAASLSELLDKLASDSAAVQRAAASARDRANCLYTAETMVAHYLELYEAMIGTPMTREVVTGERVTAHVA